MIGRERLGRLVVIAIVMFFFLSTAVLAAGLTRPGGPPPACCQLIGSGAVALKNLLLDGSHLVHRSVHRAAHRRAPSACEATRDVSWSCCVAGIE